MNLKNNCDRIADSAFEYLVKAGFIVRVGKGYYEKSNDTLEGANKFVNSFY